jgi:hypothetical protein
MISHETVIEVMIKNDISVLCMNNKIKQCYSIIIEFMMNYKKQVLITDVKMNQHCFIYQVSSHNRKNLDKTWLIWMHTFIKNQQKQQRKNNLIKNDSVWIHSMRNFAWSHMFINIHETMMINMLHQLLKRIISYLVLWLSQIINENNCTSWRRKEIKLTLNDASETAQLN